MNFPTDTTPPQVAHLEITSEQAGQRIDNFLLTYLKGVPKSHIYRILRTGEVRINKGRIKPIYRLQAGDKLRLPPVQCQEKTTVTPHQSVIQTLEKAILYEDAGLLILDKPAGLAVHGGSGVDYGVIEGLRALYPNAPFLELVHRLDRDTSGCLMIAKKSSVLRRLHDLLRQGKLHKHYLALVKGQWNKNLTQVDAPLYKNVLQSGERIVRVSAEGKPALTQFTLKQQFSIAALVAVKPLTGRTHQIRVHATHAGYPIAGDSKYGDEAFNRQLRDTYGLKRLFLHAAHLQIAMTDPPYHVAVTAPLPIALQQFIHRLETR